MIREGKRAQAPAQPEAAKTETVTPA
jgi:hypothetical protein